MLCAHLMCFGRQRSCSTIVIIVEFAEVEDVIISSIVTVVVYALHNSFWMQSVMFCTSTVVLLFAES